MAFIVAALLLFIVWREIYFTRKQWYYETLINEIPFDSIMMDEEWRLRIISGSAVKDPKKRQWMIGKTEMDYWIHQRKDPESGKKRLELFYRMVQFFQNLIGNGIKYNKSERPTVKVSIQESKDELVYVIRDNGIGISAQYKQTVFKIFHRLHGIGEYEGSGIGLAACKRIVELYGGKIWFESDETGTTFYFTLPKCELNEKPKLSHNGVKSVNTEGVLLN